MKCSVHPEIPRTARNMVPDGHGGMRCSSHNVCLIPTALSKRQHSPATGRRHRSRSGHRGRRQNRCAA